MKSGGEGGGIGPEAFLEAVLEADKEAREGIRLGSHGHLGHAGLLCRRCCNERLHWDCPCVASVGGRRCMYGPGSCCGRGRVYMNLYLLDDPQGGFESELQTN